jgi:hypothetical protein
LHGRQDLDRSRRNPEILRQALRHQLYNQLRRRLGILNALIEEVGPLAICKYLLWEFNSTLIVRKFDIDRDDAFML